MEMGVKTMLYAEGLVCTVQPKYLWHVDELLKYVDLEKHPQATELKDKIDKDFEEDVSKEVLHKLIKILKITYGGNLEQFRADMAKMALMNVTDLDGLDSSKRFLYAVWKECDTSCSFSKEQVFKEIEKEWIHNLG